MSKRLTIVAVLLVAFLSAAGRPAGASGVEPQGASGMKAPAGEPEEPKGEGHKKGSHGGEGDAKDKLNPIPMSGFPWDLSVWTVVVFVLVLAILSKFAWGPIAEGLHKRESEISAQIAEAQRKNDEARQLLAEYEKKLASAQDEVRSLIEQGRRDAEKVGQQMLDKAREEAGIERQRAVQQIESATMAALQELAQRSAQMAVELAGKIVGQKLKPADHSRLIEQAVGEFARSRPAKVNGKSS
jgi:F-type H+-transporting ATPase subunit b